MYMGNNYRNTSEEQSAEEKTCGICLEALKDKEKVAHPQHCEHTFCFECLKDWAKRSTTCPLDRKPFAKLFVENQRDGCESEVTFYKPVRFWQHFESFGNPGSITDSRSLLYYYESYLLQLTMCQLTLESNDDSTILSFLDDDGEPLPIDTALRYLSDLQRLTTDLRMAAMERVRAEDVLNLE